MMNKHFANVVGQIVFGVIVVAFFIFAVPACVDLMTNTTVSMDCEGMESGQSITYDDIRLDC